MLGSYTFFKRINFIVRVYKLMTFPCTKNVAYKVKRLWTAHTHKHAKQD